MDTWELSKSLQQYFKQSYGQFGKNSVAVRHMDKCSAHASSDFCLYMCLKATLVGRVWVGFLRVML